MRDSRGDKEDIVGDIVAREDRMIQERGEIELIEWVCEVSERVVTEKDIKWGVWGVWGW